MVAYIVRIKSLIQTVSVQGSVRVESRNRLNQKNTQIQYFYTAPWSRWTLEAYAGPIWLLGSGSCFSVWSLMAIVVLRSNCGRKVIALCITARCITAA